MYHLAYGRDVPITSWPDPSITHGPSYGPTYDGHTGIDAQGGYEPYGLSVPLYALSDGIVVAVSTPETPDNRYLTYAYSGIAPAVRAGDMVWCVEHMAECVVTVGQWIAKGQHIGYQGWTGNVEPAGPGGTHSHTKVFRDPPGQLVDPVPYVTGELEFPACPEPPQEDTNMVTMPATLYEYIDTPANVRAEPSTSAARVGKVIATGDQLWVNALANADGYTWGRIDAGWVAIAQGDTAWAVPVGAPDQSAEVARLQADVARVTGELAQRTQERDYKQGQLEQIKQIIG